MAPDCKRRPLGSGAILLTLIAALTLAAPAQATDPLFVFSPRPEPGLPGQPPPPPIPPPNGYLSAPCGLAVDSAGRIYVADHYHDAVDVFTPGSSYVIQLAKANPDGGPCGLALDSSDNLYVNTFHGGVTRYDADLDPGLGAEIDAGPATGVAVDPATDDVYVNKRTHVAVYDSVGAHQFDIGASTLRDGYGLTVSDGLVYVADAGDNTVKVFDPGDPDPAEPDTIEGPPGGFFSLRDSVVAVDRVRGHVFVLDNLQPSLSESPQAIVHVFAHTGTHLGNLRYKVTHGAPSGLAVDNSTRGTQGRVYVTSGNTHESGLYVYPPNAATFGVPSPPMILPAPLGGDALFPTVAIGGPAAPPGGISCEGDNCQFLPPEPVDPTLTTLLQGLGNPRVRYRPYARNCAPLARDARKLTRRARRDRKLAKRARRARGAVKSCRRANRAASRGSASASAAAPVGTGAAPSIGRVGSPPRATPASQGTAQGLLPGAAGFDAAVYADGGGAATQAGSHPYQLDLAVGLDQDGGGESLRELEVELPPGLLVNPAATSQLCPGGAFATLRTSPFEASASGESCLDHSQIGTVEVTTGAGGGETRRFGLFNLQPAAGSALSLGASPYSEPLVFEGRLESDSNGAYLVLDAVVPQGLQVHSLSLSLWGIPWDASHNTERGSCLNESEPDFAWSKCSVGEPLQSRPLAFLTLPTQCGEPLDFAARVVSWQQPGGESATAVNRHPGGAPAPMAGCSSLGFGSFGDFRVEGMLSTAKASSSSGFVFRLANEDDGLANPRARIRSYAKRAVVELPRGVTLNPSQAAGLEVCTPAQLAAETAFNPPGAGCPNSSKIGVLSVRSPLYTGFLRGSIYLAQPDHPATGGPGTENPFDSLLAVYLVAKSAERGLLFRFPGELAPDLGDGTITAVFDDLPQFPYTDLEVNFRSGQRAPLISPPRCGAATTQIEMEPWVAGVRSEAFRTDSPINSGIDNGPCPDGSIPPFAPEALTGGVNSNVGSYTPYYVRLSREDSEQEITSYSLVLPKGITGKLARIPFCPDAAIKAARHRLGVDETANPSCPAESQVGRTDTGYGVGSALTYAPGRIYLAGPYNGSPLSLVTINAATVGPFDLGTIVIRAAFDVEERTAQLQIDSSASDPIPHIIDGVPLHMRDIRIYMDRFQFTHNPSSCEPSQLISTLTGSGASFATPADDSTATVSRHFQLLNCLTLGFRPRLGLRLRGSARRGGYPSLRVSFVSRGARDSNLKRIEVEMPHSLFLAQNHIRTVCTREQFAAERCPEGSIYGRAVAETLLFDESLRGNVYLRSSANKLPDLVADLRSGEVRIIVEGRIGPGKHGGIRTFFDNLPDAPIDRFTMTLFGGRRGLLQNSSNICNNPPLATVSALGQNHIGARFSSELRGQCKKQTEKKRRGEHR